tara:strand:- start:604 stop:1014 length:411 start_codon:yes stop_codon:yes gene_type:complete
MDKFKDKVKTLFDTNKYNSTSKFKQEFDFESRKQEALEVLQKYSDRIPIIVERYSNCDMVPLIDKRKYLVPVDLTLSQFLWTIRKRLNVDSSIALFLFDEYGNVHSNTKLMVNIYEECKNSDLFLYLQYSTENTFG